VRAFIADEAGARAALAPVLDDLAARGLDGFVDPDPAVVRGLAYYTGTVFEVFDARGELRAVAGGGRYDDLVKLVSDGGADLPAAGFAMGNVVILDLIRQCPEAHIRLEAWLQLQTPAEVFVLVADGERRREALATLQQLRDAGLRCDLPLAPAKFNKQFQAADAVRASLAVIVGSEFPDLTVKHLGSRRELQVTPGTLVAAVRELLASPGPLLA
jgi:histidyl-tRNA synthetase